MIRFCFLFLICISSCQKTSPSFRQAANFSLIADPVSLDPRKASNLDSVTLVRMLFEGLTRISKTGETELALASAVEVSNEGLQYVFHLRKSFWSNGDLLTADDFVQSWKMILSPEFNTDIAYQLYPIKNGRKAKLGEASLKEIGVYAPDSETLIVELEQPVPYFLDLVSMTPFFCVHQKTVKEDPNWTLHPAALISNGPFQLKSWKHSDHLSLTANPSYWESKEVKLGEIDFSIIGSMDTALSMFEKRKLDWAGSPLSLIPSDAIEDVKTRAQFKSAPFCSTYFFRVNTKQIIGQKKNPLSDPQLRKALSCALDREAIVANVLHGVQKAAATLVPPEMGLETQVPSIASSSCLDIDPIVISYLNNERNTSIVQAVQRQWENTLGLKVELEAIEPKIFFQRVAQKDFQIAAGSWTADFNDPINFLEVFKFKNEGTNHTGWENGEYIDFLNRSALCKDRKERLALLAKAEQILLNEMPIIPIFHFSLNYLKRDELKGVVLSPMGQLDLRWAYLER